MFNYKSIIIVCFVFLLFISISSTFAIDNETIDADEVVHTSQRADIYFNSSALDDNGNGSKENPYKTLNTYRIDDNSNIHLADGEYFVDVNYSYTIGLTTYSGYKAVSSTAGYSFSLYGLSNVSFYGENAKDIKISVAEGVKAYPVYAIGSYAAKWSSNAEADENGFRKLEIPKAYQLCQHYLGFGAKTSGDKYYYCGIKGVSSDLGILASANHTCLKNFSTTNTPEVLDGVQQVQAGIAQRKSSDYTYSNFLKNFSEVSYILKRYTSGKVTFKNCNVQTHGTYNGSNVMRCETKSSAEKTFDNGILLNENSFDYILFMKKINLFK